MLARPAAAVTRLVHRRPMIRVRTMPGIIAPRTLLMKAITPSARRDTRKDRSRVAITAIREAFFIFSSGMRLPPLNRG